MSVSPGLLSHSATGPPFPPSLPLLFLHLQKSFLSPLTSLTRFNAKWNLAFLTTSLHVVSIFLPSYLSLHTFILPCCVWVLSGATFLSMQTSWHFFLILCFLEWTFELEENDPWISASFLGLFFPQQPYHLAFFQADLLSGQFNEIKGHDLAFDLLPPFMILNSTISWALQPKPPLTFIYPVSLPGL